MRLLTWAVRLAVFLLLVAFGAKNVEPVTLRFFFDVAVQTPLIVALFGAFAVGAFFGVLALLGTVLRQRRALAAERRRAAALETQPQPEPQAAPPALPPL